MRFRRSRRSGVVHSDGSGFPVCDMCGMAGPVDLSGHCLLGHYVGVVPRLTEPSANDAGVEADAGPQAVPVNAPETEQAYHPHDDILSWQDLTADADAAPPAAAAAPTPQSSPPASATDELLAWDDPAPGSSTLDYAGEEPAAGRHPDEDAREPVGVATAESSGPTGERDHGDAADEEDARHARRRVAGMVGGTAAATVLTAAAVLVLPF
ncbi:MAG: hypothetical protein M3415_07310 [Actinomycetota bacterium]|nr:hypothetical protein [Actinomycetota bacterium]